MKKRKPLKYHNNQDVRMDTYVKLTCAYTPKKIKNQFVTLILL